MLALIGKSTKDPELKAFLKEFKMETPRKIQDLSDLKCGFALNVVSEQKLFVVKSVEFHVDGNETYSKARSTKVRFSGYPGPLPLGLSLAHNKTSLQEVLGPPGSDYGDQVHWDLTDLPLTVSAFLDDDGALRFVKFYQQRT